MCIAPTTIYTQPHLQLIRQVKKQHSKVLDKQRHDGADKRAIHALDDLVAEPADPDDVNSDE